MIKGIFLYSLEGHLCFFKLFEATNQKNSQSGFEVGDFLFEKLQGRMGSFSNFLEVENVPLMKSKRALVLVYKKSKELVYMLLCDQSESELEMLEVIEKLERILGQWIKPLDEIEVAKRSEFVHFVVNEMITAGVICEIDEQVIVSMIQESQSSVSSSQEMKEKVETVALNLVDFLENIHTGQDLNHLFYKILFRE